MITQLDLLRPTWVADAIPIVESVYVPGQRFTSDDLHSLLPEPTQANWFGVLLAAMKSRGLIRRVDYVPSLRPERNGGVIARWERI